MTALIDLLGKNVTSPEAKAELARYPGLRHEIEEPGPDEGEMTARYLVSERDGLRIKVSEDGDIVTIFMMSEGKEGFSQFAGDLPGRLSFSSTAADALKSLGAPGYSRPPGRVGSFEHGALLRFDRPTHSVHFLFRKDAGIDLVTAIVASSVPGR